MTEPTSIRFAGGDFDANTEVVDLVNVRPPTLAPLGALHSLRVLRVRHTNPHRAPGSFPVDLVPLRECPDLEVLEVPALTVRSLDGLQEHDHLRHLDVSGSPVSDLGPLTGLGQLTILRLRHTQVADLAPLASTPGLQELDLAHTPVADLSPLGDLPHLQRLDLRATQVTDVAPLHTVPALREVVLQRVDVDARDVQRLRASRPDVEIIT